jgi:hypothetical protein
MGSRIVKKCKNPECKQLFGVIDNLMKDKKGSFKVKCPFCRQFNKLTIKETGKIKKLLNKKY